MAQDLVSFVIKRYRAMPIFMDRHDIPGVTAKAVAEAHQEDLKIQHEFDCKGLTYWFDEIKGMAFCLIEAPDKESVQRLHDYAHGLIPNKVIEVESDLVESFLGRIEDPADQKQSGIPVISDPAFRAILVVCPASPANNLISVKWRSEFKQTIDQHNGLQVEHAENGHLASFRSVKDAVGCALTLLQPDQKQTSSSTGSVPLRIGLSAGVPVSEDEVFFGRTVKAAQRLAFITQPGQVAISADASPLQNSDQPDLESDNRLHLLSSRDEETLNLLMDILERQGLDPDFNVNTWSEAAGMSKSQLYRKITAVTGLSPNALIKEFRLRTAANVIEKQSGNISEIAFESGFNGLSYFSRCFQERFQISPSELAQKVA